MIDQLRIGGTEKQLVELVNRLDRRRFCPIVVLLRTDKNNDISGELNCEKHLLRIGSIFHLSFLVRYVGLLRLLKELKLDILQTYFPESTILGALAGRLRKIPVIISSRRDIGSWHRWVNRFSIQSSNAFVDRVLANSFAVKQYVKEVERFDPDRIDVIHNGIDLSMYTENAWNREKGDQRRTVVGFVGNSRRLVKRVDLFIESMKKVAQQHRDVSFLVVGDYDPSIVETIPAPLRPLFEFTGSVSDVRRYLRLIDIGVVCSDSEGFCNVVLEYMASSIPCICTDCGGNPELIKHGVNGYLFPPGNAEALSEFVSMLVEKPPLRRKIALNARQTVEKSYDWQECMASYEAYYHGLLSHVGLT